jgi:molybdopterin converting factor subunit 1
LRIKVRFFALFSEVVGKGIEELDIEEPITAGAFLEKIVQRYPGLRSYLDHVTIAVNTEYAEPSQTLKDGDEVSFFPPLSGGEV